MLDVHLLGTGGMYPLPNRFLTSLMLRYQGETILIDCGEGTQVAIRACGLGFKNISTICFTHFHGDHIAGLPGLLMTIGNAGRTEPIHLIGPKGLEEIVKSLCVISPFLPFTLVFTELEDSFCKINIKDLELSAQFVEHGVPCYGYSVYLPHKGKFDVDKAIALGIPISQWSVLQKGESVEIDGQQYVPKQVMGTSRKGIKITYTTDLRPSPEVVALAKNSDLFICEGNYGDPEKLEKALEHKHCMFTEAALMAKEAEVQELWLTHFSPSLTNPVEYLPLAQEIFENTSVEKQETTLHFLS